MHDALPQHEAGAQRVACPGQDRIPVPRLRFDKAVRRLGAIAQQIGTEILHHLIGDRLPVAVLPVAGLLLGIGAANFEWIPPLVSALMKSAGDAIFANLPLISESRTLEDRVAYQVFGEGEIDVLFTGTTGDAMELRWVPFRPRPLLLPPRRSPGPVCFLRPLSPLVRRLPMLSSRTRPLLVSATRYAPSAAADRSAPDRITAVPWTCSTT
jgi:hypothetical protein